MQRVKTNARDWSTLPRDRPPNLHLHFSSSTRRTTLQPLANCGQGGREKAWINGSAAEGNTGG